MPFLINSSSKELRLSNRMDRCYCFYGKFAIDMKSPVATEKSVINPNNRNQNCDHA